jgi:hypothetical protein
MLVQKSWRTRMRNSVKEYPDKSVLADSFRGRGSLVKARGSLFARAIWAERNPPKRISGQPQQSLGFE